MAANGLVKVTEECGELSIAACELRDACEGVTPVTDRALEALRRNFEDEAGDLSAAINLIVRNFALDWQSIEQAIDRYQDNHTGVLSNGSSIRGGSARSAELLSLVAACGRLIQVSAKKLSYFHTDIHPDGAGSLAERLQACSAEVLWRIQCVMKSQDLDMQRFCDRVGRKSDLFAQWHAREDNNAMSFTEPAIHVDHPDESRSMRPHH